MMYRCTSVNRRYSGLLSVLRTRAIRETASRWQTRSFGLTPPPNPNWDLGEGLSDTSEDGRRWREDIKKGWKSWDMCELAGRDAYQLLTSAVIPRPIAFVSTLSSIGTPNLAPMSYFNLVSHKPPLLSVSFLLSPRRPKDTLENILATKEFTVNIISEPFVEAANACAVEAPEHVNEWVVSGLTPEPSTLVKPPRVQESAVGFECELNQSIDISAVPSGERTTVLVLGLIKRVHVRNAVLAEDQLSVDPAKLLPVARLAGGTYARLGDGFDLERPSWKALKERIEAIHKV